MPALASAVDERDLKVLNSGNSVPMNEVAIAPSGPDVLPMEPRPAAPKPKQTSASRPKKILVIDLGGSNVKVLATGQTEVRKATSGSKMTPDVMVETARKLAADWKYEAVALGFPGIIDENGPVLEPGNLGKGWVGFDFTAAFGLPVKLINDAAMQALGSYEGGRMLFLGLGTGLGSTLISDRTILPLELGGLPYKTRTIADYLKKDARKMIGDKEWEAAVTDIVGILKHAFLVDYIMLGGGAVKKLKSVPPGARLGDNENAFVGGYRLWNQALPKMEALGIPRLKRPTWKAADWRVV